MNVIVELSCICDMNDLNVATVIDSACSDCGANDHLETARPETWQIKLKGKKTKKWTGEKKTYGKLKILLRYGLRQHELSYIITEHISILDDESGPVQQLLPARITAPIN